jgi:hypothetical protein
MMPGPFQINVVVPRLVPLTASDCALVAPDLGQPLAMDRPRAGRLPPRPLVGAILTALLDAGVEAPGFVPRNLFCDDRDCT